MHVLVFGGSRNIGYFTTLRLLNQGHSATLLLRNTSVFDNDVRMQPHVESGRAQLVQGDALVSDDVKSAWDKATDYGRAVDYVIFTIGATPDMSSFKLTKGFTINPPNITTKAILNVLCTMPDSVPRPKLIAATSIGVTKDSPLPLVYKPLYGYLLREPHADKLGLERVLAHVSGREWNDREPRTEITTVDEVKWQDRKGLPPFGSLEILILRLPIFADSNHKSAPLPLTTNAGLSGTYTISREEVAHFIAESAVKSWDQFKGKAVTVSR
ncbi:hypothetical protein BDM02DRAFT_3104173 [Thelephora ganbajun]|uniref:Uncharacterized protein n=1 Tax=Thelephora ganbajun TaxID=370292 RepID=A0ACB6Z1S8_THEGA|nr:hypothetical protein BDM02DRAFT_3104173 [Thelephora ganbajun]